MQTLNTPRAAGRAAAINLDLIVLRRNLADALAAEQRFQVQADEYRALAAEQENFRTKVAYFTHQTFALDNAAKCRRAADRLQVQVDAAAREVAELEAVMA